MRKLKTKEHWLSINGFPNYEVSNHGKIRSVERIQKINGYERLLISKELSTNICNRGWCNVMLSVEGKGYSRRVHRLVAEHFLPLKKDKNKVLHVDGDRRNNHIDNLRWVSYIGKDYYVC